MKSLRQILKMNRSKFSIDQKAKFLQENFEFYKKFQNFDEKQMKEIEGCLNGDEKECVEQFFNVFYKNASVHDQIQFELYITCQKLKEQNPEEVFIDYSFLDQDSIKQGNIIQQYYLQQQTLKQTFVDMLQGLDLTQLGSTQNNQQTQEQKEEIQEIDPTVNQKEIKLQNNFRKF